MRVHLKDSARLQYVPHGAAQPQVSQEAFFGREGVGLFRVLRWRLLVLCCGCRVCFGFENWSRTGAHGEGFGDFATIGFCARNLRRPSWFMQTCNPVNTYEDARAAARTP